MLRFKYLVCRGLLLLFVVGFSYGDESEEAFYLNVVYVGDAYQRLVVLDKKKRSLFNRKLIKGQSFSIPLEFEGKLIKQYFIQLPQRELTVKVGCNKKQLRKSVGSDVIEFRFQGVKPACVVKDKPVAVIPSVPGQLKPNDAPATIT